MSRGMFPTWSILKCLFQQTDFPWSAKNSSISMGSNQEFSLKGILVICYNCYSRQSVDEEGTKKPCKSFLKHQPSCIKSRCPVKRYKTMFSKLLELFFKCFSKATDPMKVREILCTWLNCQDKTTTKPLHNVKLL